MPKLMNVLKRGGDIEEVSFDKVSDRVGKLSNGLTVDVGEVVRKVCSGIFDGVRTCELDELAAHICSSMLIIHPDYGTLASRIIISNHQKNTSPSFSETITTLYEHRDENGDVAPLVTKKLFNVVMANREKLNSYIDYSRDFAFDFFGFKTLERGYLLRCGGRVVERPQHMIMRVAIGIHGSDVKDALKTYDMISNKFFTHATPTLFNAGTPRPQMSSCFLLGMEDSVDGIFDTLKDCAHISKYAGGIGLHIHDIRAQGSRIKGTNGLSSGICPMLRVFNNTARFIDQAGKRKGSIAVYLEPWHGDIEAFLEMRKNHGAEEDRARDLFYALWIPDLFMERVKSDGMWSLMCPKSCPGLSEVYGDAFVDLYERYEAAGRFIKQVKAQTIWFKILESQIETGTPYMCYKDAANSKSNQKNIGVIKSSNLCSEIIQVSSPTEIAVCNLASICLPTFISSGQFDFKKLHDVTKAIVKNLNKIIDTNFYPLESARKSNLKHRPIGMGVQGLADAFVIMRMPFDSVEAAQLNKEIFETIYHAGCEASMELAKARHIMKSTGQEIPTNEYESHVIESAYPGAYSSFAGSPASQGILQFDLWGAAPWTGRYDWDLLKADIVAYGMRNSLLVAPMPTASTSQIMAFNECFEPFTSNIFARKTLSGEFIIVNKYLVDDLMKLGMWNEAIRNQIIIGDGSVQGIDGIPSDVKALYKTVWEIKQKTLIDMAADRGIYVCQSQSLNLFVMEPDFKKLSSMHFYVWEKKLKTTYYLRTRARAATQKFTVDPTLQKFANLKEGKGKQMMVECTDEVCLSCGS